MQYCSRASELIRNGQKAIVLFSCGDKFRYDAHGNGESGNWKVDLNKIQQVKKVIIYLREKGQAGGRIFVGNYAGLTPSNEEGRQVIFITQLEEVCTTTRNWWEFSGSGPNPVCYLK